MSKLEYQPDKLFVARSPMVRYFSHEEGAWYRRWQRRQEFWRFLKGAGVVLGLILTVLTIVLALMGFFIEYPIWKK